MEVQVSVQHERHTDEIKQYLFATQQRCIHIDLINNLLIIFSFGKVNIGQTYQLFKGKQLKIISVKTNILFVEWVGKGNVLKCGLGS